MQKVINYAMAILAFAVFASCAHQGKQKQVAEINVPALNPFVGFKVDSVQKLVIVTDAPRKNGSNSGVRHPIKFGHKTAQGMLTRLQQPTFALKRVVDMYVSYYIVFLGDHDDILCAAYCSGDYFSQISFIKSDGLYFPGPAIPFNGSNRNCGESKGLQTFVEHLAKIDLSY